MVFVAGWIVLRSRVLTSPRLTLKFRSVLSSQQKTACGSSCRKWFSESLNASSSSTRSAVARRAVLVPKPPSKSKSPSRELCPTLEISRLRRVRTIEQLLFEISKLLCNSCLDLKLAVAAVKQVYFLCKLHKPLTDSTLLPHQKHILDT